jgi:hypothetical protein
MKYTWVVGLVVTLAIIVVPIILSAPQNGPLSDDAWGNLPKPQLHTDHSQLLKGPYKTGAEVTRACLACHPNAGKEVMQTIHWTWESEAVYVPERGGYFKLGKKNAVNNFCIGIQSNWPACTACHAGYGWSDANYDFSNVENVDCLVCHDSSGAYAKADSGYPAEKVDLAAVAQSVAAPTRENCGGGHFFGGGGEAVKHGDLDGSLYFPNERIDVHMGKYDFECVTCHQTDHHKIKGRSIAISLGDAADNRLACTDCHSQAPHSGKRINKHVDAIACQTCHIPVMAKKEATKTEWDWSAAGQDIAEKRQQLEHLHRRGTAARLVRRLDLGAAFPRPVDQRNQPIQFLLRALAIGGIAHRNFVRMKGYVVPGFFPQQRRRVGQVHRAAQRGVEVGQDLTNVGNQARPGGETFRARLARRGEHLQVVFFNEHLIFLSEP